MVALKKIVLVAITPCEEVFLWHTALLEDYTLHIDDTTKQLLILLARIVEIYLYLSIYPCLPNHFTTAMALFNNSRMWFLIAIYCFIFILIVCRIIIHTWCSNFIAIYLQLYILKDPSFLSLLTLIAASGDWRIYIGSLVYNNMVI